jgi:predicted nuclease of predicted toxin-antitoxin system
VAKVLLDACVPHWLRKELAEFEVETAHFAGLAHLSDSELLAVIEGQFDILVTLDRNLMYQQKIAGRSIAVVVLRVTEQTPKVFRTLVPPLSDALRVIKAGEVKVIGV